MGLEVVMASSEKTVTISLLFKELREIQDLNTKANKVIDSKFDKPGQEERKAKIIEAAAASGAAATIKKAALIEKIKLNIKEPTASARAVTLLEEILNEPKTTDLKLPTEIASQAIAYGADFDKQLYQYLLPYTKLAYEYETNGSPEEHAFKLSVIFKSKNDALTYLNQMLSQGIGIHDACLFTLPDPVGCNFSIWKDLAKKYMNDAPFRKLLGQACEIQALINADCKDPIVEKSKAELEAIEILRKSIEENKIKLKKLKSHATNRQGHEEQYLALNIQLANDKNELLRLRAGMPIDAKMDLVTLLAYQERYIQESSPSYKYMLSKGLTKKDYEKFVTLDRTHAGENIPEAIIDGATLGHPGYYLKKVNVQNDEEAARAACFGKLTNCCQSLSGEAGEPCTIHGLTNPNGGFYIICAGIAANPTISDKLIGQTWVWRSQSNALVFDSIEHNNSNQPHEDDVVIDFYKKLGKELCISGATHKVAAGAYSGISNRVSNAKTMKIEQFCDYYGYSDSREKQLCIFDINEPWHYLTEDPDAAHMTDAILVSAFESKDHLIKSQNFYQMLQWMIRNKDDLSSKALEYLNAKLQQSHRKDEIEILRQNIAIFLSEKPDLDKLCDEIEENRFSINAIDNNGQNILMLAIIAGRLDIINKLKENKPDLNVKDNNGSTALHFSATNPVSLKLILSLYPEKECLATFKVKNDNGNTPLHLAATNPESFETILKLYPENERLAAIQVKNSNGDTPLLLAARNPELLKTILSLLQENERLAAVNVKDKCNRTLLYLISDITESLETILRLYPENERLGAIKATHDSNSSPLKTAATNPESLKTIFNLLPENVRLEAIKFKDNRGSTPLHQANHKMLETIVSLLPQIELIKALQVKNNDGNTPLHQAANNHDLFKKILELFPNLEERLAAVKVLAQFDQTLLHLAVKTPESLKTILDLYPENDRLTAVQVKDVNGDTPLHLAVKNHESLKTILNSLQKNERLEAIKAQNHKNCTPLHLEAKNPEFLKAILNLLPKEERLEAVQVKNSNGDTSLHLAATKTESLKTLLDLLPVEEHLAALQVKNRLGCTPLHLTATTPESLETILNVYPKDQRLAALQVKNNDGQTPLNLAVKNFESLKIILKLLPQKECLEIVQVKNSNGDTFLHLAATKTESLKTLIDLLPVEDHFTAVQEKDRLGRTPLHLAVTNLESFETILKMYPEDLRLAALQVKSNDGQEPLRMLATKPESIKTILRLLPEKDCRQVAQLLKMRLTFFKINVEEILKQISHDKEGSINKAPPM